ncbi:MAG: 3-dehydroquinate synthase [Verrucomicrobiales bacterium]|jgi:3-dehydroquinate synthase
MNQTVHVDLGNRAYDVIVGEQLLASTGEFVAKLGLGKRCAIVTDSNVGPLFLETVENSLKEAGIHTSIVTIPAGEASKSMNVAEDVCRQLLRAGLDRKSFVVALGGGVIGDLAGFCAAILNRGVPFVQIPTTVVSLVDSSVGGKTGVNAPEGKNLIGAFHQPSLVIADVDTLKTMPNREYREGFAEVIKHAAIRDSAMFDLIEAQGPDNRDGLVPLIARNVAIKARVVEEDEKETSGVRALLNFGHTIGHGFEGAAGYGQLLHGEAVSIGLMAALRLSERISGLPTDQSERVQQLLAAFDLPQNVSNAINAANVLNLLSRDKKFEEGRIRFVLLRELGDAFVSEEVSQADIEREVERLILV